MMQIKLPAPSRTKTAIRLLPRNSLKKPAAANAKPKTGTPAGSANANVPIPNARAKNPKKMLMYKLRGNWSQSLTFNICLITCE